MTNLDTRIGELRVEMEDQYLQGNREAALEVSRRLDRLIALAQRESMVGEAILYPRARDA